MSAKKRKYSRAQAIVALNKGDQVVRRVERVARQWVDVWVDGYGDLVSQSQAAMTGGGYSWSSLLGASSTLTLNIWAATIDTYAALLGCGPDSNQTIDLEFDSAAEDTDPVYFEVTEQLTVPPVASILTNPTPLPGGAASAPITPANIDIFSAGGNVWGFRLKSLAAIRAALVAGTYAGTVTAGSITIRVSATYKV